jgi:glycosyltransferase involved in cell wall biosynthesis
MKNKNFKIALIHDYLREYGGAERVLEALHELYPEAPVYVSFVDQTALGLHWAKFKDWDIRQSWITKIPFYKKLYSPLRVLAPQFFGSFNLSKYDVIISSSNMYFAKAVKKTDKAVHISYCHTPPRSLYGYTTMTDWKKNPVIRYGGSLINHYLRVVDYYVSQQVDFFIANSEEVKNRIKKFYRREAVVIYPPVDLIDVNTNSLIEKKYYLFVGRLAFAKHPEIAVEACNQLHLPLKLVGTGSMMEKLKSIAGPNVELLGAIDDQELHQLYAGAKALLFPVEDEDFGIVPVEAMGHGVPVIAHNSGGPKETVIDNKTGVIFDDLSVAGLTAALKKFAQTKFDRSAIIKHAQKFSKKRFQQEIDDFVKSKV